MKTIQTTDRSAEFIPQQPGMTTLLQKKFRAPEGSELRPASDQAGLSRRKFMVTGGAAAAMFSIVPRHVLGGAGFVAPSEKITLAQIGCGTQGLREMPAILANPEVQLVAVCDPSKESRGYVDWSGDGLRSELARALGRADWRR